MRHLIERVREFHQATGAPIYDGTPPSVEARKLRADLLEEEVAEYLTGADDGDVIEQVDGAGDTLYLLAGDCVVMGWGCSLPLAPIEWRAFEDMGFVHDLYRRYGRCHLDDLAGAAIQALVGLGYDPRKVTDEIADSNMSKLLKHERDEIETARAYDEIGVMIEYRGEYPTRAAVSAGDQVGADGKHYPKGKVLKSVYWREPDFSGCLA